MLTPRRLDPAEDHHAGAARYRLGRHRLLLAGALCATVLTTSTAAQAAYAPKLDVTVAPATPRATAKIVSTITQAVGETANRKVVVSLPAGFASPPSLQDLAACQPAEIAVRACPEPTTVGSAQATASIVALPVELAGTVHWGGPLTGTGRPAFKLVVFLDNAALGQHLTLEGIITIRPDGGFDTTFDNLPDTLTTRFMLTFDGGSQAIVQTPDLCGPYTFRAAFTGQKGEQAEASAPVTITDCPPGKVQVSTLKVSGRTLRFTLGEASAVRVVVRAPGDRRVLDRRVAGRAGANRVTLPRGRKGRYRVTLTTLAGDRPVTVRRTTYRVR